MTAKSQSINPETANEQEFLALLKAMPISTFNRFIDLLGQERLLPPVEKAVAK